MTIVDAGLNDLRERFSATDVHITLGQGTTAVAASDTGLANPLASTRVLVLSTLYDKEYNFKHILEPFQYASTTFTELLLDSRDQNTTSIRNVFQAVSHSTTQASVFRGGIFFSRGFT